VDTIRVGMVGAGWIAQEHRRVLGSMAGAELAAVCDIDLERAEALAAGTGARTYPDWRDLLDREDLGALVVCTPPRSHRDPAVAALNHGLPVYLEKPIARTLEDAAAIVAAAGSTGTVCAVGYQWHALDLLAELPGLLAGQQVGLLVGTNIGPTQSRPWFTDMRAGGGNLLERGSHHLDLARAVAGEVVAVQAAGSRIRLDPAWPAGHLRPGHHRIGGDAQARSRPGLHPLRREPGPAGHPPGGLPPVRAVRAPLPRRGRPPRPGGSRLRPAGRGRHAGGGGRGRAGFADLAGRPGRDLLNGAYYLNGA
jgi:predicted dehydrogenase